MKHPLFTTLATGVLAYSFMATAAATEMPIHTQDDATLLRNFALAHCVGLAFEDKVVRDDAEAVAGAYVQFGNVNDSDAYLHLSKLARAWLERPYASHSGSELKLMKCIDFQQSAELLEAIGSCTK